MTEQVTQQENKRPTLLTVLCILSFIGAGFGILGYITAGIIGGAASAAGSLSTDPDAALAADVAGEVGSSLLIFAVIGLVVTLISLFGVIKMWKLQKQGFYIYVGASIVAFIMTLLMTPVGFPVMPLVFMIVFIVLYGMNLKHMK